MARQSADFHDLYNLSVILLLIMLRPVFLPSFMMRVVCHRLESLV